MCETNVGILDDFPSRSRSKNIKVSDFHELFVHNSRKNSLMFRYVRFRVPSLFVSYKAKVTFMIDTSSFVKYNVYYLLCSFIKSSSV